MKSARVPLAVMVLAAALLLCGACARSPRCSFYTLTATAQSGAPLPPARRPSLAVTSVTVPELVDRPQLVLSSGGTQVRLLETHRWAEPLKGGIARTVAENLSRLLAAEQVSSYPQNASLAADYRMELDLLRFDALGERVELDALWTIRGADGGLAGSGRSRRVEAVAGRGEAAVVSAFSRGLAGVCGEIAQALRERWH